MEEVKCGNCKKMVDAENCWYNHSGEDAYCCDCLKFVNN